MLELGFRVSAPSPASPLPSPPRVAFPPPALLRAMRPGAVQGHAAGVAVRRIIQCRAPRQEEQEEGEAKLSMPDPLDMGECPFRQIAASGRALYCRSCRRRRHHDGVEREAV